MKLKGQRMLYLCAYYRPSVADETSLRKLVQSHERASQLPKAHLLIGGDFNFPGWDWQTTTPTLKPRAPYPGLHHDFHDLQAQYEVPMYAKANWTSLKEMAVNLSSTIVESKDTTATEELWNIFKTTLQNAVKEHIPHKTTRAKISQPWVTAEIRKLIHNRN